ncbi:GTP cyclohydrolase I FolE [Fulvivirga sp. 29W222]|uniref:GTP cyclohydrolase 1 n=1 Tax=Fulvivirga marina TaxID=2494733 RepID=A0A937G6A4_9BACT|nr:GTP cyclohydrolase I FolE [Fulvivirga marina]MBL6449216.1 GTP cyclohydrolase I FolE [Fulvivirga marina]
MKPKEILLNTQHEKDLVDEFGDDHVTSSYETPLRPDAFDMSDDEKIKQIEGHFREIMNIMGLDLNDDSLSGTPKRVAKMFVKEVFSGLNPANKPHARLFENKYKYDQMLVEKDITFYSHCEHHFVPIFGKVHVAYISSGKVIGLSKINRIVQYYAKRPQVQERLTVQISKELQKALNTEDVGVVVDATHLCVASRGVGDTNSKTGTAYFMGKFKENQTKNEFLNYINSK